MSGEYDITVENKLIKEKRDINVYHQSTRSAHIISRSSSITLPLKPVKEDDYLHISVVSGPGHLWKDCWIDLPSWMNFEFTLEGKGVINHWGDRTLLKIPPGPPTWQLKMTRPNLDTRMQTLVHITISDSMPSEDFSLNLV
jgi:hypothetical protein